MGAVSGEKPQQKVCYNARDNTEIGIGRMEGELKNCNEPMYLLVGFKGVPATVGSWDKTIVGVGISRREDLWGFP